jgi:hypothetical protein
MISLMIAAISLIATAYDLWPRSHSLVQLHSFILQVDFDFLLATPDLKSIVEAL